MSLSGIGSTMKNMLGGDHPDVDHSQNTNGGSSPKYDRDRDLGLKKETSRRSTKLPAGTGPGTTGKPAAGTVHPTEVAMQQDADRARTQGIAGYGTDAAAASGGSLGGTHTTSGHNASGNTNGFQHQKRSGYQSQSGRGQMESLRESSSSDEEIRTDSRLVDSDFRGNRVNVESDDLVVRSRTDVGRSGMVHSGTIREAHFFGHTRSGERDAMPSGDAQEDTTQLLPVTHERVRHLETEEISRVLERERHIHHIQHHTQPIIAAEELAERDRELVHPLTLINETHANKVEDNTLFEGQVRQYHDTLSHTPKERTVIDKGTVINEIIHHHVHHVIQPVIEKETIEKQRIHTTIPIREVTHEAPVVHQSQTHAPVPIEHFLERGGTLEHAVSQEDISKRVLHSGDCVREVEGIAESLERDLNLDRKGGTEYDTTKSTTSLPSKEKERDLSTKKAATRQAGQQHQQHAIPVGSRN